MKNSIRSSTDTFQYRPRGALYGPAGLLLLLAIALLLCSCGDGEPLETAEAPAPAVKYAFAASGETDYAIVRGDSASDTVVKAAAALRKALSDKTGAEFRLYDEFSYARSPEPHAIVVGTLGDSAAEKEIIDELKSRLLKNDYVIAVRAGELFILGGSDKATAEAVEWFKENMPLDGRDLVLESGYTAAFRDTYLLEGIGVSGDSLIDTVIVHGSSDASKELASKLSGLLGEFCGIEARVINESKYASGRAFFVGCSKYYPLTDSDFNKSANFRIYEADGNLIFTSSGPRACDASYDLFSEYLNSEAFLSSPDLKGLSLSGDVTGGKAYRLIERTEGTDLRVMQSNVLISSDKVSDEERAELLADTYSAYAPDVITLNEFIYGRGITKALTPYLNKEYETVEAPCVKLQAEPGRDADPKPDKYATPVLYRKDSGITLVDSGFSYLSDNITYHGFSYAVLEKNGVRFCVLCAHFSDNRDESGKWRDIFAKEALGAVEYALAKNGGKMPVILAGDWFFWKGVLPYNVIIRAGYGDAGIDAKNAYSTGIGTFHTITEGSTGGAIEDLIFYSRDSLLPLAHRVVVDQYTVRGSDHYPVVADFAFSSN